MAALVGKWEYVAAENLDGYMQAAGKFLFILSFYYTFLLFFFF